MDISYPMMFLANALFLLFLGGGVYFFVRSFKDGYWGEHSEDVKYDMLRDEEMHDAH